MKIKNILRREKEIMPVLIKEMRKYPVYMFWQIT